MVTVGDVIGHSLAENEAKQKARNDADVFTWILNAGTKQTVPSPFALPMIFAGESLQNILMTREKGSDAVIQKYTGYLDIATAKIAKWQLQNVMGVVIPDSAVYTQNLFSAMADLTRLSGDLSGLGIVSEVVSMGQIDRLTDEIRKYIEASGATQLTSYGYGLILERVLGDPVSQELNAVMQHALIGLPELITTQTRRDSFNPDNPEWDADLYAEISKYGLSKEKARKLLAAYTYYPGPQDWIRFAVRDVFNPVAVADGGYDESFPDDILEYSRKAGVKDETMRQYWRAHWQIPSPNMLYEMLHRDIITEQDAVNALRTDDWAPKWIPKLIEMAYQPLTRVDARRMFDAGVITPEEYKKCMRNLGYSADSAEMFVKWAQSEKRTSQRDLTVSQVQKSYDLGLITESEYKEQITRHGYDDREAEILAGLGKATRQHALSDAQIKLALKKYTYGVIDEAGLSLELDKAGMAKESAEIEVERAKVSRSSRRKLPPKEDVLRWYKKGLITSSDALSRLSSLGYNEADRALYLKEISSELPQA